MSIQTLPFMEYAPLSQRTANRKLDKVSEQRTIVLGLYGEGGEVCDILKKVWGHGHSLNVDKLWEELGDVLWYVAAAWHYAGQPYISETVCVTFGYDGVDLPFELMRKINKLAAAFDVSSPSIQGHTWSGLINQIDAQTAIEEVISVVTAIARQYNKREVQLADVHPTRHIMWLNVEKLKARYPEGFDNERSINRNV